MNIVLYEPELPANTGNIGRTCVATNTKLHLIEPLGFQLNEKMVKRAGLDYWDKLDATVYDDFNDFLVKNPGTKIYMATTKAHQTYTDVEYEPDCFIMFLLNSLFVKVEHTLVLQLKKSSKHLIVLIKKLRTRLKTGKQKQRLLALQ